ncbi:MAG: hypothetical protein CMF69_02855 [Magnetovibrio sp.]|nr:hypothetical protein [Magnetovibrio sp.]|tara:strand:- start:45 stop:941 length:897 start_codon:yes stop_codon:yes gene_type:complete
MIEKPQFKHALFGAAIGGIIGFNIGIAGFGSALSGLISLAALGAYLGWGFVQLKNLTPPNGSQIVPVARSEKLEIRQDEPRFKHALIGAIVFGMFGFFIGITGFGSTVSGLFSLGILGAYLGWNFYQLINFTPVGDLQITELQDSDENELNIDEEKHHDEIQQQPIYSTEQIDNLKTRVLRIISLQLYLMEKEPPNAPQDDFSIGYVFGVVDGCLQDEGFASNSAEATGVAILVFFDIYGGELWKSLLGKVLDKYEDRFSQIFNGASTGARDYLTSINSTSPGDYGPMGWATHEKASQ